MSLIEQISGAAPMGGNSGLATGQEVEEMMKALTAGYGTDVAALTGAAALRVQSLDHVMQSTIVANKHFRLFNRLPKPKIPTTVDEWTEQNSIGGFLGGATNTETGNIDESTGGYARRVGMVKYLMTRRQISFVVQVQQAIRDLEAQEFQNGALELLSSAEYLCFEGDSAVVPTEFDGIFGQILGAVAAGDIDGGHAIDLRAGSLSNIDYLTRGAQAISSFDNYGQATDLFCSQKVQADLDVSLDPAYRVPLTNVPGGGLQLGSPVSGVRTSFGDFSMQPDVFVRDGDQRTPFDVQYAAVAAANVGNKPTTVTAVAASDPASQFTAAHAGNYYYGVAGVSAKGESAITLTTQTAVTAGQKVTLTITGAGGGAETGYAIYRSRLNGTNAPSDMRLVKRIAKAGTFVDLNADIPGTSKAALLNLNASDTAITWRQMLPMTKFPLYPTTAAVLPWAQLLFGYLRISKRKHHVVYKNILPRGATWKPFN